MTRPVSRHLNQPGVYMRLNDRHELRRWMVYRGHTSGSLAAEVGVHRSFIGHLMSGYRRTCKPTTAERVAAALDCPPSILFTPRSDLDLIAVGRDPGRAA